MQNASVPAPHRPIRFLPRILAVLAISGSLMGSAMAQTINSEEEVGQVAAANDLSSDSSSHEHSSGHGKKNPARVTDQSRSESYNDFVRAAWVPHEIPVDQFAPGKKRAFFTASSFLKPPVTVDEFLRFIGNRYRQGLDLVLMRCKPSPEQRAVVQPFLATWPNVFPAIVSDLGGPTANCSLAGTPGERQICRVASRFVDSPQVIYTSGLAETLVLGSRMFATQQRRDGLDHDYGIFPAFTGLGFTVQASSTPDGQTVPMTNRDILRNFVVPEYLLKQVPLAQAGCHCVRVPESEALHAEPVDPDFIWSHGELDHGACVTVDELEDRAPTRP